jgi:hypothetical protein
MDDFLEILQLPKRALGDRIEQELQENPVLELEASDAAVGAVADPLAILQLPIQALRDRIEEELSDIIVGGPDPRQSIWPDPRMVVSGAGTIPGWTG